MLSICGVVRNVRPYSKKAIGQVTLADKGVEEVDKSRYV